MPLLNYTTKIDIFTTIGQIQGMLVKHGANRILQEYDEEGHITGISFMLTTPIGMQAFRLPANTNAVSRVLTKQRVKHDFEQAERVAWRIVKDWIEAQMAIIESEMVKIDEVFMPYMISHAGQTFYQLFESNKLQLNTPEAIDETI